MTGTDITLLRKQLRLVVKQFTRKDRKPEVFARDGGVASGVPNVTWTNSHNNLVAIVGYLLSVGMTIEDIIRGLMACLLGDDNALFISTRYRHLISQQGLIDYYLKTYGWVVKCTLYEQGETHLTEFCSCYWQQLEDGTYLYSPKVGRVFSKTFHLARTLRDKPTILRGMVSGLGHEKVGYLLSNMLKILDNQLCLAGVALPEKELRVDWSAVPLLGTTAIVVNDDPSGDCLRYQLKESDLSGFLLEFHENVKASDFPYAPICIPRGKVWDTICNKDYPRTLLMGDGRMDFSLPNRQLSLVAAYLYYTVSREFKAKARALRDKLFVIPTNLGSTPDLGVGE